MRAKTLLGLQLKALRQEHQQLRETAELAKAEQAALQAQLLQLLPITHASTQMNRRLTVEVGQVKHLWQQLQVCSSSHATITPLLL